MAAVAVRVFGNEQIVADQQRRDHRSRGNAEGLEGKGANEKGDQNGVEDGLDRILPALGLIAAH
jgi:hypothetical protein